MCLIHDVLVGLGISVEKGILSSVTRLITLFSNYKNGFDLLTHCELWLEMKGKTFRVAILVPDGIAVVEGFASCDGYEHPSGKTLYVTKWYDEIAGARDEMDVAAKFYNDKGIKFLFFRELRKPLC